MKSILAVLIFSSTAAALTMLAESDLVLQLLCVALRFAATVLPHLGWIIVKFIV